MKIEIDDNTLIDEIVKRVVEQLTPLLTQNSKSNDKELMNSKELSVYLGKEIQSIYDKVHHRTIPFLKEGNLLKFRRKDIDLWLINPYHPDLNIYNLNHNGRG